MFYYEFMQNAFLASAFVSLTAGTAGYFLVIRGQSFAGHALSHIGFAGAACAGLFGFSFLAGMIFMNVIGGVCIGLFESRTDNHDSRRDVAIGVILSLALGIGVLFLHFYTASAAQATRLLFGNLFGVDRSILFDLGILGVGSFVVLMFMSRPLLFISIQPEVAEARGLSPMLLSVLFLGIVAIVVAITAEIVGTLLVFTLLVAPAAAATKLASGIRSGLLLAVLLAIGESWTGIILAYMTDWPVGFWITALGALAYSGSVAFNK